MRSWSRGVRNCSGAIVLTPLVGVATVGSFGPIAAYLTERFPSELRSTGFGVGYSLALVIPAFYAFYLSSLGHVVAYHLGPVILIVLAGILVVTGAVLGPETKDARSPSMRINPLGVTTVDPISDVTQRPRRRRPQPRRWPR